MSSKDGPSGAQRHSAFFDLERDPQRDAITRPASMLRSTEWGGLTLVSMLAGLAFPPYFFAVMALACLNAGGMLWVTHLNEAGRKRLKEFESEFAVGHALEEAGDFAAAAAHYTALVPRYEDQPKIAQIAVHRVAHLKQTHPEAFSAHPLKSAASKRAKRAPAAESAKPAEAARAVAAPPVHKKMENARPARAVLRRKPA
ncbi:MAG TPA: hypothetical protein VK914_02320 [bacterium]|jgi:hypothetical protein|nr:hypothetical protein [bacterium]